MNLREIEERVAAIEPSPGVGYLADLLLAYGLPRTSVSRLMSGTYDRAETADERLWKDKVYFRYTEGPGESLYEHIDAARADERVVKHRPRFLIVKNDVRLLAGDQKTGATLDIEVGELASNATFFGAWAGFEKSQLENLNYVDRKAAEKMAKLYDEVIRHNSIETDAAIHDLNVFFPGCCSASSRRTPGSSSRARSPMRSAPTRASQARTLTASSTSSSRCSTRIPPNAKACPSTCAPSATSTATSSNVAPWHRASRPRRAW